MSQVPQNRKEIFILCVDDESDILANYSEVFQESGFSFIGASSGAQAAKIVTEKSGEIGLIISDLKMPEMTGIELRAALLPKHQDIPFVMVSGYVSRELALKGIELKIAAFIDKPFNSRDLVAIVEKEGKNRFDNIRERLMLEKTFFEEAGGLLEEVEPLVLSLESDPHNPESLNAIFRLVHTVKGSSGVLEDNSLTKFAHKFEDLISKIKNGNLTATQEVVSKLLFGLDILRTMITSMAAKNGQKFDVDALVANLAVGAGPVGKAPPTDKNAGGKVPDPAAKQGPKDTLQVPTAMLDEVMSLGGEITVIRNMVNKLVRSIEKSNPGNRDVALLTELLDEMHKINSVIQTKIVDLRKVPVKTIFRALPRTLRDLSTMLKKDIVLSVLGDSLRVDTTLAQALANSIVHLVRNSADHGLETTEDRIKLGKPKQGKVTITCTEDRDEVIVAITDDGRGVNASKVRQKAIEKGMYTAEDLAKMNKNRLLQIIFESGFSTATQVTDVSGRGVGMDMVRSSVEAVGGRIDIDSDEGKGATFSLHLPIPRSVLIINSLLVEVAERTFAVPQDSILRLLRLESDDVGRSISTLEGKDGPTKILRTGDEVLPVLDLRKVLDLEDAKPGSLATGQILNLVVVEANGSKLALMVDAILDSEEIVVKPLHQCIDGLVVYGGATFMGDGRIGLILDVEGLAERANFKVAVEKPVEENQDVSILQLRREYLIFTMDCKGLFGMPLAEVFRLEEFDQEGFSFVGNQRSLVYRDDVIPIVDVCQVLGLESAQKAEIEEGKQSLIIVASGGRNFGLAIRSIQDVASTEDQVRSNFASREGILGTLIVDNRTVTVVSPVQLLVTAGLIEEKVDLPPPVALDSARKAEAVAEIPVAVAELDPEEAPKATGTDGQGWGLFD